MIREVSKPRALALTLLLACAPLLHAEEAWVGTADVTFKGYSLLHEFTGTVPRVPLKVLVSPGRNGRVVSATSAVEVKQMSTRNEDRDRNMMAMFAEPQHRLIEIEVVNAEERALKPHGTKPGTMTVALTIAGRRRLVSGTVSNVAEAPEAVSFDLSLPVSLQAFSLAPPTALGGLMKVKDTVDVTAQVALRKKAP